MKFRCYILIPLSLLVINAFGQSQAYSEKNIIHEITPTDPTQITQFSFLSQYLQHISYVGLGEASHGTQEFYEAKGQLCKYLVNNLGFTIIAFEIDELVANDLNNYVQGKTIDIIQQLKNYGLYNSAELKELFDWLKAFNHVSGPRNQVRIVGFDRQEYWSQSFERDSLMADNLFSKTSEDKCIIWGHNIHLVKSNTWDVTNSNVKAMGNFISEQLGSQYYFIALDTQKGALNVVEKGKLKVYEFDIKKDLLKSKYNRFYIDFKYSELNLPYQLSQINSNWQGPPGTILSKTGVDFDALIFIRETTPSKPIE
jgi:erythromycin esterase-like protein